MEFRNHIPAPRPRRLELSALLGRLLPGQSLFVPGCLRGYAAARRASLRHGFPVRAMRDREGDVRGMTFWREL